MSDLPHELGDKQHWGCWHLRLKAGVWPGAVMGSTVDDRNPAWPYIHIYIDIYYLHIYILLYTLYIYTHTIITERTTIITTVLEYEVMQHFYHRQYECCIGELKVSR